VQANSAGEPVTKDGLLIGIHGSAIRLSSDYYRHYQDLRFLLESLQTSGDVILKDDMNSWDFLAGGDIRPSPQALETIAAHELDKQRHRDIVKLTRRQLFLGWAMFAIASATLIVEFIRWRGL